MTEQSTAEVAKPDELIKPVAINRTPTALIPGVLKTETVLPQRDPPLKKLKGSRAQNIRTANSLSTNITNIPLEVITTSTKDKTTWTHRLSGEEAISSVELDEFSLPKPDLTSEEYFSEEGDIELENNGLEHVESSFDVFFDDKEEDELQFDTDYAGYILLNMGAEYVLIDINNDGEEAVDEQHSFGVANYEDDYPAVADELPSEQHLIGEQFMYHFETLESDQAEKALQILELVTQAINNQINLEVLDNSPDTDNVEIKALCVQLFECIGMEYDEELIVNFLEIIYSEKSQHVEDRTELNIELLNKLGTREYKPQDGVSLLGSLLMFLKLKLKPNAMLGRCALQVLVA